MEPPVFAPDQQAQFFSTLQQQAQAFLPSAPGVPGVPAAAAAPVAPVVAPVVPVAPSATASPGEGVGIAAAIGRTISDVTTTIANAVRPQPPVAVQKPLAPRPVRPRRPSAAELEAQAAAEASAKALADSLAAEKAKKEQARQTWTLAAVGAGVVAAGALAYTYAKRR